MATLRIHLRDTDPRLVAEWRRTMGGLPDVEISEGDILAVDADAIVSPANSFGFMDGGIDLAYSERFGFGLERQLQARLRDDFAGELLVGQAVVIPTGDARTPWLVSAPTMRLPTDVRDSVNAYLAFRAALRAVGTHLQLQPATIGTVVCPGMCTGIGAMSHARAASQMRSAYDAFRAGPPTGFPNAGRTLEAHRALFR
jgi:O-acetyl-ADP-ribose deacetylase (regulator of RNase III)